MSRQRPEWIDPDAEDTAPVIEDKANGHRGPFTPKPPLPDVAGGFTGPGSL